MRRKQSLVLLLFFWMQFANGQTDASLPASTLITKFKFEQLTGGVIVVKAKVNDLQEEFNFILDTGSGGISLDSTTAAEYMIANVPSGKKVHGIAGIHFVNYAQNSRLTFQGLTVDSLDLYINDYNILSSVYGIKIDGIIGYSFFRRYIVTVDFDNKSIGIYTPGKFKYPKRGTLLNPSFTSLPIQQSYIMDEREILSRFYIDTGAGLCVLVTRQFLKDSGFLEPNRKMVPVQVQGLGGKKLLDLTVIKRFRLGPYRFRKVPTTILEDEYNALSYPHLIGLIGNDIFRRFNLVINYPNKEFHMVPNTHYRDKFDYSWTGTNFFYDNGQVHAGEVMLNSPAAKAGLKSEDIILGVNNNFSGKVQAYNDLMTEPGKEINLVVLRGKEVMSLKFTVGRID